MWNQVCENCNKDGFEVSKSKNQVCENCDKDSFAVSKCKSYELWMMGKSIEKRWGWRSIQTKYLNQEI